MGNKKWCLLFALGVFCTTGVVEAAPKSASYFKSKGISRANRVSQLKTTLHRKGGFFKRSFANGKVLELADYQNQHALFYKTNNLDSVKTLSADTLWPESVSDYQLDGNGQTVAIWDTGLVRASHRELSGRVINADGSTLLSHHSTHVAGTIIASGVNASAKGFMPAGTLLNYNWSNDIIEMSQAALNSLKVSNHSYGYASGWEYDSYEGIWYWYGSSSVGSSEDYKFGYYGPTAQTWDAIAHTYPNYLIVKAAGNDRSDTGDSGNPHKHADEGNTLFTDSHNADGNSSGYDTIGSIGTAKNILTVGAIREISSGYSSPEDVQMSTFSGWGPVDDGRIKPDLVAKGVSTYSTLSSADNSYGIYSGTSMAAPAITGGIGLIHQHQENLNPSKTLSSAMMKGLLIHTANEAGDADGPDYVFGWGVANIRSAVELIDADFENGGSTHLFDYRLTNTQVITHEFLADGSSPIKATLVWTDPEGNVQPAAIDNPSKQLINDLDIRITHADSPESEFYPWVLDPNNPELAAIRADNSVDNVEQILINAPFAGKYTITISHKGTLHQTEDQKVALILSGNLSTDIQAPQVVHKFQINTQDQQLLLTWENPSEPDLKSVTIFRSIEGPINSSADGTLIYTGTEESFLDTGLINGTTYYYGILTEDTSENQSEMVSAIGVPADLVAPDPVTGIQAIPDNRKVRLQWVNPNTLDFQSIMIRRSTVSPPLTPSEGDLIYVGDDISSFEDDGLSNGTEYFYSVFSGDEVPNWSAAQGAFATPVGIGIQSFEMNDMTLIDNDIVSTEPKLTLNLTYPNTDPVSVTVSVQVLRIDTNQVVNEYLFTGMSPQTINIDLAEGLINGSRVQTIKSSAQSLQNNSNYVAKITITDPSGSSEPIFSPYFLTPSESVDIQKLLVGPNPYNPELGPARIQFQLSTGTTLRSSIYTISGQRLWHTETLGTAGTNEILWDGLDDSARMVGNGVYIVYLETLRGEKQVKRKFKLAVLR